MVLESERASLSLGKVQYGIQKTEEKSLRFKRSVYVMKDVNEGETFTKGNIRVIRPSDSLPSRYFDLVLGKKATAFFKAGPPFTWNMVMK